MVLLVSFLFFFFFDRRGRLSGLELISGPEFRRTQGDCAFNKLESFWSSFSFFFFGHYMCLCCTYTIYVGMTDLVDEFMP